MNKDNYVNINKEIKDKAEEEKEKMHKDFCYEIDELSMDQEALLLNETIFHNANGYIGVRGSYEEGYPRGFLSIRGQYMNAFYDIVDMKQAEALCGLVEKKQTIPNVADTQRVDLVFGERRFSVFEGTVKKFKRTVDMKKGVTCRQIEWVSPEGWKFTMEFKRMTSFVRLPLFLQQITITSHDYEGDLTILSGHCGEVSNFSDPADPRVADESVHYLSAAEPCCVDNRSYIAADTARSGLTVCSGVGHRLPEGFHESIQVHDRQADHKIIGRIQKGVSYCFYKYSWFEDSVRKGNPGEEAKTGLQSVMGQEADVLYGEQEAYLNRFWEQSELEIVGDEELNSAVHYNQYALLESVGKDEYSNIAAKGLSGEGYEGHFFWDTEMYSIPCFNITRPEIAKGLLAFRYRTLGKARQNARQLGHEKGALYPWRTINGEECSGYFPSGSAAYHINGDIAYAVTAYYLATGDRDFLCEQGAEILLETARLWMDTGNFTGDEFHIQEVTGPDEYTCMVNNNYYTNSLAKYNLEWAIKSKGILEKEGKWDVLCRKINICSEELHEFERAAENMYLPYDEALDINPQDDSFLEKKKWDLANTPKDKFPLLLHYHPLALYRRQVCKQADTVLAHFILEDYQKSSTIRNSFLYYEGITTHDSSLSTCIFSSVAARLGMMDKAYVYFGESAKMDLFNTHKNTKDGIHTANMAGNYMAVVYGFAGLRIKESGLYLIPQIPKTWTAYRFRFQYHGTALELSVDHKSCELRRIDGNPVSVFLYGQEYFVKERIRARRYKGIIFDLDGVICHTDRYHCQAWKSIADDLEIPFDKTVNDRLRGVSRMESLSIILEQYKGSLTEAEKEELAEKKNGRYRKLLETMSPEDISFEVRDTLEKLREQGMKTAIGSSSKNAQFILQQVHMLSDFDAISDGCSIKHSKPHPEVFLKAAEMLGLEPEECLVVEDARSGVDAALAGGFDCAGIGDAALYEKTTYPLKKFEKILSVGVSGTT